MKKSALILSALTVVTSAQAQAQATAVSLRHDLFSRPRPAAAAAAPVNATAASDAPAPAWRPRLRALVVAGVRSMVLVDATVVELGGSVDGYRLQAVDDNGALFVKGRQRVTLVMGQNMEGQ
jgi:hypothetical protein